MTQKRFERRPTVCPSLTEELRRVYGTSIIDIDNRFKEEALAWLPDRIFDAHVHLGLKKHHAKLDPERKKRIMAASQAFDMSISEFYRRYEKLLPGKTIDFAAMPFPFKETKINAANEYILSSEHPGFILCDMKKPEETCRLLPDKRVLGLKVYWDLVDKPYFQVSISDMVCPEFMETLDKTGKVLILHVPGSSVNSLTNLSQLEEMCDGYKRTKIVLAHMGRCFHKNDARVFDRLSNFKNLYLDSSTISNESVFRLGIESFGSSRVLFGSDAPYCFARQRIHYVPQLKRDVMVGVMQYEWTPPEARMWYMENRPELTFLLYHELHALRVGISKLNLRKKEISRIFYENAVKVLGLSDSDIRKNTRVIG